MADMELHLFVGIVCDKCRTERRLPKPSARWGEDRYAFMREAYAAGWRRWLSRGTRDYCPDCEPNPGHTMREVRPRG